MTVDVALFGATGFVGRLTADQLATHLPAGASWAIAGRNRDRLRQLVDRIGDAGHPVPSIIVADHTDPASMRELAESTRVLISTVGPYLDHGEAAVKAATEAGIGYLDLTGEPQFVDAMWLAYHDRARDTGATIVHACGFDSVPYDLGVLQTVRHLPSDAAVTVKLYVRADATVSGGTWQSAVTQFGQLRSAAAVARDRRAREPRPSGRRVSGGGRPGRAAVGGWQLPLPTIDPQIVLRSARALDDYGPDFRYEHYAHISTLPVAVAAPVGLGAVALAAQIPPLRSLLLRARSSGDGPSPSRRERSWFKITILGEGGGEAVRTTVSGGDPGYDETAVMLSQAALCLAFDPVPGVAGQTTTAVAMGDLLTERLVRAGIGFVTEPA